MFRLPRVCEISGVVLCLTGRSWNQNRLLRVSRSEFTARMCCLAPRPSSRARSPANLDQLSHGKLCWTTPTFADNLNIIIPIVWVWPARWIWTAMERDTSRVYDVITTPLTMTYPACRSSCRSQHRRSVETNEQTAARLSAQLDYARRQRSCETLEQAYCRRAANRSRSHYRRITKTPGFRR